MNQLTDDPLISLLEKDVTIAWDIVSFVVMKVEKRYAWLIATIDDENNIPSSVIREAENLIESHRFYAELEEQLTTWELDLSLENGRNQIIKNRTQVESQGKKNRNSRRINAILKAITFSALRMYRKHTSDFQAAMDPEYKKARIQLTKFLGMTYAQIETRNIQDHNS
jgi:hypothetical protein